MSIVYQVRTGNCLPRTREFFDCWCDAKDHVKSFIKEYYKKLSKDDLALSIYITRLDKELVGRHTGMFPTSAQIKAREEKGFKKQ